MDFFTKNPNLIFFWGEGEGGMRDGVDGARVSEDFFSKNPNLK